ncbi:N-acetylmuramoyl-L-alanine amidase [Frisingicoccus sp.]|uniref:N-acetylmuramoyl-L-alanine amidase n=1 Tax=Frisingicoccus sp. TaxID=1918627 RepID=UPI003AB46B32
MQIIKIIAIVAAVIVCVALALFALGALAFGIAADIMERQDSWTDNGEREAGKKNDREA